MRKVQLDEPKKNHGGILCKCSVNTVKEAFSKMCIMGATSHETSYDSVRFYTTAITAMD